VAEGAWPHQRSAQLAGRPGQPGQMPVVLTGIGRSHRGDSLTADPAPDRVRTWPHSGCPDTWPRRQPVNRPCVPGSVTCRRSWPT
jgi:hypothetical protein